MVKALSTLIASALTLVLGALVLGGVAAFGWWSFSGVCNLLGC